MSSHLRQLVAGLVGLAPGLPVLRLRECFGHAILTFGEVVRIAAVNSTSPAARPTGIPTTRHG
jgi:ABC-type branched-subunit amino acid transport system permease subunit